MKWTGDPNWNYIFDGRFYTKEDLKWMGASESPGEILKTPEDWDASIKKLSEKCREVQNRTLIKKINQQ